MAVPLQKLAANRVQLSWDEIFRLQRCLANPCSVQEGAMRAVLEFWSSTVYSSPSRRMRAWRREIDGSPITMS